MVNNIDTLVNIILQHFNEILGEAGLPMQS